jgi:hypothetical protein
MNTPDNSFFSWAARRFLLLPQTDDAGTAINFDLNRPLKLGGRAAQLMSFADEDDDYAVLIVGDPTGLHEVPMRIIESEMLLMAGAYSHCPAEILIAAQASIRPYMHRELVRQLCTGGPLHDLANAVGAQSVVVDWLDAPAQAA